MTCIRFRRAVVRGFWWMYGRIRRLNPRDRRRLAAAQQPAVVVAQQQAVAVAQQPVVAVAQQPAAVVAQQPAAVVAQQPAVAVAQQPAVAVAQQPAVAVAQQPAVAVAQQPAVAVAQQPAAMAAQQPAAVAAQQPAAAAHSSGQRAEPRIIKTRKRKEPKVAPIQTDSTQDSEKTDYAVSDDFGGTQEWHAQSPKEEEEGSLLPGIQTGESWSSDGEDVVTPWTVPTGAAKGLDYEKLIAKFGCSKISQPLVGRMQKLTGSPAHHLLRRGLYFAHRDLDRIMDRVDPKEPFFLYTVHCPISGSLHLGHLVPFIFAKYLQEAFDVPLVIQMTDDEKFLWNDVCLEEAKRMAIENAKDIVAVGFDLAKTFIFIDAEYMCPPFYENMLKIRKMVSNNQIRAISGIGGEDACGQTAFPAIEAARASAPASRSFSAAASTSPALFQRHWIRWACLCVTDVWEIARKFFDPFFRMSRDVAARLEFEKPATIYSGFLPALQGVQTKMSASKDTTFIYISDTPEEIENKIQKYAYSGGGATQEEHCRHGGNCDIVISFQYLRYFLEDDKKLEDIRKKYLSDDMSTGELKQECIRVAERRQGPAGAPFAHHRRRRPQVHRCPQAGFQVLIHRSNVINITYLLSCTYQWK